MKISRHIALMKIELIMKIERIILILVACLAPHPALAANLAITSLDLEGRLSWTNAFTNGVCTVEKASTIVGPWLPEQNYFTTNVAGQAQVPLGPAPVFYRLLAVDISPTPAGFTNLLHVYGVLETIAGKGEVGTDGSNGWRESFEGGFATNANLSRPHFAMADDADNVFIVDKDSHSVLKVTPDGRIHTVAGTHVVGDDGDGPAAGAQSRLNFPNGLWVRGDGTVYILDTGNSKVRRLDTNGVMTTLFTVSSGITSGRGLWVKGDESVTYFCSGSELRKRVPGNTTTLNNNFTDLGNIVVTPHGDVVATDRGDHRVFLVDGAGGNIGNRTRLAGNGRTNVVVDGALALTNSLYGVRAVWPMPNGGYLLGTHEGCQLLFLDAAGVLHVLLSGRPGDVHAGDGQWFYSPGLKVGELRSITMDRAGHLLIVENDFGYVRRIRFQRMSP